MSTYYERNKDRIKENRRKRYEQKKQNNVLSMNKENKMESVSSEYHTEMSGKSKMFLGTILLFSVFLVWQGAVFFMKQGYSQEEAWTVSIFGELLLIVSSGLIFYAETQRTKQVFTVICSLSIILLGAFLHSGVKKSLVEANPEYQRVQSEYSLTKSSIAELKKDKEAQPQSYKTKRNAIQETIESKLKDLKEYSQKLSHFESMSMSLGEYYIAWIRIALMILNAYLVHALMRSLAF